MVTDYYWGCDIPICKMLLYLAYDSTHEFPIGVQIKCKYIVDDFPLAKDHNRQCMQNTEKYHR